MRLGSIALVAAVAGAWNGPAAAEPRVTAVAEARLAAAWGVLHPGQTAPPACELDDPVRELTADFDAAPGLETALASLRWGVVLLGADGHPLAAWPIGCGTRRQPPDTLELSAMRASGLAPRDVVVRQRHSEHCGTIETFTLLARHDEAMSVLASIDERSELGCGASPRVSTRARIDVVQPGELRVTVEGTSRAPRGDGSYTIATPLRQQLRYLLQGDKFVVQP